MTIDLSSFIFENNFAEFVEHADKLSNDELERQELIITALYTSNFDVIIYLINRKTSPNIIPNAMSTGNELSIIHYDNYKHAPVLLSILISWGLTLQSIKANKCEILYQFLFSKDPNVVYMFKEIGVSDEDFKIVLSKISSINIKGIFDDIILFIHRWCLDNKPIKRNREY